MSHPSQSQVETLRPSIDALVRVFRITDSAALGLGMPKLNPPDIQALLFVARNPDCIAADVGAFLGVVPTTTSALVDRLVRQGLMLRARTEANRWVVLLRLTETGEKIVRQIVASFYRWRAKYGGMDASMVSQMKAIEDENRRLKRMYADLSMQNDLLNCEGERHWSERT